MSKLQTSQTKTGTLGAGALSSKDAAARPARRLGRGLSSLLGTPVKVDVPASSAAKSGGEVAARGVDATVVAVKASRAERKLPSVAEVKKDIGRDADATAEGARIVMVDVGAIVANRFQPRRRFDEAGLNELAASIRAAGVVQPVLVRRAEVGTRSSEFGTRNSENVSSAGYIVSTARSEQRAVARGTSYELVAGERRWRAAKIAGLTAVPAVVAELSDEQAAEWALIENVQRTDLQPLEQAHALKQLCEKFGHTHARAAEKLGLDRTTVTNLLRLTELEDAVQKLMEEGRLSGAHAKVLLGVSPGPQRVKMALMAAAEEWSVRELTVHAIGHAKGGFAGLAPVKVSKGKEKQSAGDALRAAGLHDLQEQLAAHLGTKVQIRVKRGGKSGEVVVRFYDLDHFDGLMGKMGFVMR